jgi:hypothetical protein
MKNLFIYFTLLVMTTLGMWVSFTWNIPVDNQIGMFVISCLCLSLLFMVMVEDIKNFVNRKNPKPQKF